MSGIEVVSLAIGVVPVVLEVVKSFRTVKNKIRTLRNPPQAIRPILIKLQCQETKFKHECRLLSSLSSDDDSTWAFLNRESDLATSDSSSVEIADREFRQGLKEEDTLCVSIVGEIQRLLREIDSEVSKIDAFNPTLGGNNISFKSKIKDATLLCWKESDYLKRLEDLESWNSQLVALRSRLMEPTSPRRSLKRAKISHTLPMWFTDIHKATKLLYETLMEAWKCENRSHLKHFALLWLNARIEAGGVRHDIAIRSHVQEGKTFEKLRFETPIWLYVKTISINLRSSPLPTSPPTSSLAQDCRVIQEEETFPKDNLPSRPSLKRSIGSIIDKASCKVGKKPRVHFEDSLHSVPLMPITPPPSQTSESPQSAESSENQLFDLRQTRSMCCHLNDIACSTHLNSEEHCVGYLESEQTCRYEFYNTAATSSNTASSQNCSRPVEKTLYRLPMLYKLKLARELTMATLKFCSTPWTSGEWRLHNLFYFTNSRPTLSHVQSVEELMEDLKTLHFTASFPEAKTSNETPVGAPDSIAEEANPPQITPEAMYGIRNQELSSLAVALLEIAYGKPLRNLCLVDGLHDVVGARMLLKGSVTPFGLRYTEIVQKCLSCDFGFGADLGQPQVQNAVYSEIVCPLEEMIAAFEKVSLDI
ncbi:hypothetical protein BU16DRAFT_567024 [Lophium mytilinum]|uniref:DUF7580 domain-containing protein n=1 Tax=Lophium mytilinum TaxID=390894 RepID=A0A6A6QCR2_9PEZI|nr:hypothetical protein BU16DRAFT_567024 [Lophium mytilinum]